MFFFRKKDKEVPSNEKNAARSMPRTKKVQFMPTKLQELTQQLNTDVYELTKLEPVNYYADKSSYFQCTFFYQEDYSEVYFVVEQFNNDFRSGSTPYYKGDYDLMKKVVIKFGQRI